MRKGIVIGLSGVAGAGKDLFCEMIHDFFPELSPVRYALADNLKQEVTEWTIPAYGIDAVKCSREDKAKIRDFLVFHGGFRRRQSEGQHWTSQLTPCVNRDAEAGKLVIVTDIRYDVYPEDEVFWMKNIVGGKLVHISAYEIDNECDGFHCGEGVPPNHRHYLSPPNEHERMNDPKLKAQADYLIEWERQPGELKQIKERLKPEVDKFITWLKNQP